MPAQRLDGAALAQEIRSNIALEAKTLAQQLGRPPGLAVVLVGENPASQVYVRNKVKACGQANLHSELIQLPASTSEAELLGVVDSLNARKDIDGILVQLPLPEHIDSHRVIEAIAPDKDVDGFHLSNAGALMVGRPLFQPCTPFGVMRLLEKAGTPLRGAEAVVVGASNIVGKPMALMLQAAGATVTICNSKTRDLASHTRRADILVAAVGRPHFIQADQIKPGAVVIDVGINRLPTGELVGDVDTNAAMAVASAITPVPGGVGPMTIAMLLENTLAAARRKTGVSA